MVVLPTASQEVAAHRDLPSNESLQLTSANTSEGLRLSADRDASASTQVSP